MGPGRNNQKSESKKKKKKEKKKSILIKVMETGTVCWVRKKYFIIYIQCVQN